MTAMFRKIEKKKKKKKKKVQIHYDFQNTHPYQINNTVEGDHPYCWDIFNSMTDSTSQGSH